MTALHIDSDRESLEILWDDGERCRFPFIWLRDNAPDAFHPETRERVFDFTLLPPRLDPPAAQLDGAALHLTWADGAVDRFDLGWLRRHRPGARRDDPAEIAPALWRGERGAATVPRFDASAIMASDMALLEWLRALRSLGVTLIDGAGTELEAGPAIGRRVGHLRETNFGVFFEVRSKPDPNNLAYTAEALPLHTDLPNQELPPGIQFLHCLANDADGGGSVLADGLAIAEDLAKEEPDLFEILASEPIPFRFHDDVADIRTRQTVIVRDGDGRVREVCFSPHLTDVLDLPAERLRSYYEAFRAFVRKARDPDYSIALQLEPGQILVFDNRRVLHGRQAFDPRSGRRHLNGFYVDRVELDSRIRVLSRQGAGSRS